MTRAITIATKDVLDAEMGRRLEDWIVSTLDDSAGGVPLRRRLGGTTARFSTPSAKVRPGRAVNRAAEPGDWPRFRVASGRGITVVSLTDEALVREHDLEELVGDLLALIDAGHHRLVLDFGRVDRLSIRAAGALAEPVRRCHAAEHGALKVCGLRADVAAVFAMVGLDRGRRRLAPDAASAINGPWPEAPSLRPLPVSVLAALTRAVPRHPTDSPEDPAEDHLAMTAARLVAQTGPEAGRAVAVDGRRLVIGRAHDCRIRLGFATVSRHHAAIERRDGRLELVDLGSTNGTVLNGRVLRGASAEVRDGDRVQLGPMIFTVEVDHDVAVMAPSPAPHRSPRHVTPVEVDDWLGVPVADDHSTSTGLFLMAPGGADRPSTEQDWLEEFGLKCEVMDDVIVVTPQVPGLDDEPSTDALRDGLDALFGRTPSRRVVVHLVHVGRISGRAIGVLLAHHLRLDREGGALRVCGANARVSAVLDGVRLGMLVECHPTVEGAVLAPWPSAGPSVGRA